MTAPTPESIGSLNDRIDQACDRFEQCWDSDAPISIEDLLREFSDAEHHSALRELLAIELELRFKRGDSLRKEEYLSRLPQHSEVVSEIFDLGIDELMETTAPVRSSGQRLASTERDSAPRPAAAVPDMIGKYRIVEALDRGGQATVYRAVHPELGRDVVIKFCHFETSNDPNTQEALRSEGRVLASLEHPNLARVYDFDIHENRAYLVMEYVRGLNLSQFTKQTSPKPGTWIPIVRQVAEALSYVHEQGVLHLDIKPQNILIDEAGTPRLIDFGLARTETVWDQSGPDPAMLSGTLAFMSPEQACCDAERVGPKSDIFGLGGVMYFLATGAPPIRGKTLEECLAKARSGDWDRDLMHEKADAGVRDIVELAMATEPDQRFENAKEMGRALAALSPTKDGPSSDRDTLANRGLVASFGGFGCLVQLTVAMSLLLVTGISTMIFLQRNMISFSDSIVTAKVPSPPSENDTPVQSGNPVSSLKIRTWRNGEFFQLVNSAPIATGDRIEVRSDIPAGFHVSLCLFDSSGALQLIDSRSPTDEPYEYRFPTDRSQFEQIVGPSGTEFVFLCGRKESPITEQELRDLGLFDDAWPQLPEDAVIELRRDKVDFLQRGRGFGGGVDTVDPQQQVFDQLSSLRVKLQQASDFVEGIAFSHVE